MQILNFKPQSSFMEKYHSPSSILFIAPLPPPLTGHSIADQVLLEGLIKRHNVDVIDLSIDSQHDGTVSLKRIFAVLAVIRKVFALRRRAKVAYLTISESVSGNLKDLLIIWLLRRRVRRIVLHLHGGSLRVAVLERWWLLTKLNKAILSKVDRIIITGKSHEEIFIGFFNPRRLTIVPNFALQSLFNNAESVRRKFTNTERIRVLYISGMGKRKGYTRLLDAYLALPLNVREKLQLDFAGRFDNPQEQSAFEERILTSNDVFYHGVVDGEKKRDLFAKAHVFCLPTAYLEGQPLTILEAYASGCAVLTTPQPGILDVFEPGVNGHLISADDTILLTENLFKLAFNSRDFEKIALYNLEVAQQKYRPDKFCDGVFRAIENFE